jgi:nitric oxide synthase oxygenase domain/subunit
MILLTMPSAISHHETAAKAARHAHRWLRRTVAVAGEWATILDPTTGAVCKRYVRRADGRVERRQ